MKVYTFSTGGNRDDIYLQGLASTISGVGNLIGTFFRENYDDRQFSSIQLVGNRLLVWYIDLDTLESKSLYYDLISFDVISFFNFGMILLFLFPPKINCKF